MADQLEVSTARIKRYFDELRQIFRRSPSRHQAHHESKPVLEAISTDPEFLTDALRAFLSQPSALNRTLYPVIAITLEANDDYSLLINCWLPLPDRATDMSTKPIHHHGDLLITSATVFGPGYEHWMFTTPVELDPERKLYSMKLIDCAPHVLHEVVFVDNYICHVPIFPASLTLTLALWSSKFKPTWRDKAKRLPVIEQNKQLVRQLAIRMGFRQSLHINNKDYIDFYPVEDGFIGIKDAHEFALGPNQDYLTSLFHVFQQVAGDRLVPDLEQLLASGVQLENPDHARRLLADLKSGKPIEAHLSEGHYGIPMLNFHVDEIRQALRALESREKTAVSV